MVYLLLCGVGRVTSLSIDVEGSIGVVSKVAPKELPKDKSIILLALNFW